MVGSMAATMKLWLSLGLLFSVASTTKTSNADASEAQTKAAVNLVAANVEEKAPSTCDTFKCPARYAPKVDHHLITGTTRDQCCDPTCELFECKDPFTSNEAYYTNVGASSQVCCDMTCGTDIICDPHYVSADPKAPGTTKKECCKATCAVFNCTGSGWWKTNHEKLTVVSNKPKDCCTPLCGAVECSLEAGWQRNGSKNHTKGTTPQECCKPYYTCASDMVTCMRDNVLNEAKVNETVEDVTNMTAVNELCCWSTTTSTTATSTSTTTTSTTTTTTTTTTTVTSTTTTVTTTSTITTSTITTSTITTSTTTTSTITTSTITTTITTTTVTSTKTTTSTTTRTTSTVTITTTTTSTATTTTTTTPERCAAHTCSKDTMIKNKSQVTGHTDADCCLETCLGFAQCNINRSGIMQGWLLDPKKKHSTDLSVDNCCQPTCRQFTCNQTEHWIQHPNNSFENVTASTPEKCCLKTCGQMDCPAANINLLPKNHSDDLIVEDKEWIPTCCHDLRCAQFPTWNKLGGNAYCNDITNETLCSETYAEKVINGVPRFLPCWYDKLYNLCRYDLEAPIHCPKWNEKWVPAAVSKDGQDGPVRP